MILSGLCLGLFNFGLERILGKVSVEKLGFWVIFEIVGARADLNIPLGSFKCNKSF